MSYLSFSSLAAELPAIRFSEAESAMSGLRVARVNCPAGVSWSDFLSKRRDDIDSFDLVIMRYPSTEFQVAQEIQQIWRSSWIADTLLYLSLDVTAAEPPDSRTEFIPILQSGIEIPSFMDAIFGDYSNHYAANSFLGRINVAQAYSDWMMRFGHDRSTAAYVLRDGKGQMVAVASIDLSSPELNELNLAGVLPSHRRGGMQAQVIRHVAELTRSQRKPELFTSTQSANVGSLRAYIKEGFGPVLSVNTLHIMPGLASPPMYPESVVGS